MSNEHLKFTLHSIVEKNKLNEENFLNWERNLRIVLKPKGREEVLPTHIPTLPKDHSEQEKKDKEEI